MSRYPKYLRMVVAYMVALILGSTFATMHFCDMSATDSFYFVVQTLWTVGYGDVVPAGAEGRLIAIAVMLFGTVGITSALGVVGGMILDKHSQRHATLEREVEKLSAELDRLNNEMGALDEDIAKPENYSDAVKISKLMAKKEELQGMIDTKEEEWLTRSSELEELNGQDN